MNLDICICIWLIYMCICLIWIIFSKCNFSFAIFHLPQFNEKIKWNDKYRCMETLYYWVFLPQILLKFLIHEKFFVFDPQVVVFDLPYVFDYLYLYLIHHVSICISRKNWQNICICIWYNENFLSILVFDQMYLTPTLNFWRKTYITQSKKSARKM